VEGWIEMWRLLFQILFPLPVGSFKNLIFVFVVNIDII